MSPSHRSPASNDRVVALRHAYEWAGGDGRSVIVRGATGNDLALSLDVSDGSGREDRVETLMTLCVADSGGRPVGESEIDTFVLGDRNLVLAELVRMTFGNSLDLQQRCSNSGCAVELEWPLTLSDLSGGALAAAQSTAEVIVDDHLVILRPATVADERRIRRSADPIQTLINICADPPDAVPTSDDEGMKRIEATLESLDPLASVEFKFACHVCGQPMRSELDLPDLTWDMVRNDDMRRSDDYHLLAAGYGWSPAGLLALRPTDRVRFAAKLIDFWEA